VTDSAVAVADSGNSRIQSFDLDLGFTGKFTDATWGAARPIDTAIDDRTGHVFVALDSPDRVDEFNSAGVFVKTIGSGAVGAAVAVEVDPVSQLVFVAKPSRIDVYSAVSGKLVDTLPVSTGAKGLAVNSADRLLYVSSSSAASAIEGFSYDPPPTCTDAAAATLKNVAVSFTLTCGDLAGSPGLEVETVSGPSNGSVSINPATGAATYTPAHHFTGEDAFSFRATTANGVTKAYNAKLTVIPTVPIVHVSANLGISFGEIFIKLPGTENFVPLTEDELVPLGTIIDASDGHCIATFANADKSLYSATFWGGVFEMGQGVGDKPPAVMKLRDDQVADANADNAIASVFRGGMQLAAKKKKKKKNKVWGDGKGNFTTTGSGGSASVRGTRWLTENRADGTFFKVTRGKILVKDYAKHKSITLRIGDSYFAEKKSKKKKKKKS
jgi:hypothetical protein